MASRVKVGMCVPVVANSRENREPTSGLEPLTCSLRVRTHTFVGVPHCSKNRLLKPSLPISRFPMFAVVRPGYCHGYCQTAAAVHRCSATHVLFLLDGPTPQGTSVRSKREASSV